MSTQNRVLVTTRNLRKLAEECGELIQIAMKVDEWGIESSNPLTNEHNRDLLQKEMTDVMASIENVADILGIDLPQSVINSRLNKLERLYGRICFCEQCGTEVEGEHALTMTYSQMLICSDCDYKNSSNDEDEVEE
jgi:NTP pyrophosphatase (non-canonical NTP hydrolase)